MDSISNLVIVRDRVTVLRNKIAELATYLRAHIGTGADAHEAATEELPGFMSAELYSKLLGFQSQIDDLKSQVAKANIPDGIMLYYYNTTDTIPDGYILCNGNSGTLNFSNKFALGIDADSKLGVTGGHSVLPSFPTPRHRHQYKNYVCCEIWSELSNTLNSNSNLIGEKSNNKYGSNVDGGVASMYPLYYTDYTEYSGNTTSSSAKPSIIPPYRGLHVIKRHSVPVPIAADALGSLHILVNTNVVPSGLLVCNGQWVSATLYRDLYRYALSSGLVVPETAYTSELNTYGACTHFAYNDTTKLLRLPTINNVIAARTLSGATATPAQTELKHFHGLGKMVNNNGNWGKLSYSNATYPGGATGYFWNGSGGHSTVANPDAAGDIITSQEIVLGITGNGEIANSTNVIVCIRAFHDATASADVASEIKADAEVLQELASESTPVYYMGGNMPGFRKENGGITEVWSTVTIAANKIGSIISVTLPVTLDTSAVSAILDVNSSDSVVTPVLIDVTNASLKFKLLGTATEAIDVQYRVIGH